MKLQLDWPLHRFSERTNVVESSETGFFCLEQGRFVKKQPDKKVGFLQLLWEKRGLEILFDSQEYQCLIDGCPLQTNTTKTLRLGMIVQAGQYRFSILPATDNIIEEVDNSSIPSLDELLMHGGFYTPWLAYEQQPNIQELGNDILKHLSREYRRYLLWGDQPQHFITQDSQEHNRLPERDNYLDNILESVKGKTISECIFDETTMIDRVLNELMTFDIEAVSEEELPDLLTAVAPENLSRIQRKDVSELMYRELYKLGLESHL